MVAAVLTLPSLILCSTSSAVNPQSFGSSLSTKASELFTITNHYWMYTIAVRLNTLTILVTPE